MSQFVPHRLRTLVGVVTQIARVVVDVTGVDKPFDYLIPAELSADVAVGSRVRVPLHRREVPGWVMAVLDERGSNVDVAKLLPLAKVTSCGPSTEVVALIEWAVARYASRRRPFYVSASPQRRVPRLLATRYVARERSGADSWRNGSDLASDVTALSKLLRHGRGGLVQCGPASNHAALLQAVIAHGPTLVIVPTVARARRLAAECRRLGASTAVFPDDWVTAASGVDVVIGARSCVWASVPQLASIVVIDEHDDTLQEERSPTWHARDIAIERAQRAHVPCLLVSAVATISARHWAGDDNIVLHDAGRWPTVQIVDRSADDRWASSLVTSALIEVLRNHDKRVVCVLNVKGRARALACDS